VLVKAVNHQSAIARRMGIAVILSGVALLSSACAIGQHAATATDRPAIDGTTVQTGLLKLDDISIQAPDITTRSTGKAFYAPGDNAPMTLVIDNNGHTADVLTGVTGASTSWSVVATAKASDKTAVAAGATSVTIPPGGSVSLGLSGLGVGSGVSPQTLVLQSLTGPADVYPGSDVPLTFTFKNSPTVTVEVPVQLTSVPNDISIPAPASGAGD
jgi:copper(I)-binding protein